MNSNDDIGAPLHHPPVNRDMLARLAGIGGNRQRTAALDAMLASLAPVSNSFLAARLLTLLGWGRLQASDVRWLAEGAELDGTVSDSVRELARCGTDGVHAGNVRRDMLRKFNRRSGLPLPTTLTIKVHDKYFTTLRKAAST